MAKGPAPRRFDDDDDDEEGVTAALAADAAADRATGDLAAVDAADAAALVVADGLTASAAWLTPSFAVAAAFAAAEGSSGRAVVGGGFGTGLCGRCAYVRRQAGMHWDRDRLADGTAARAFLVSAGSVMAVRWCWYAGVGVSRAGPLVEPSSDVPDPRRARASLGPPGMASRVARPSAARYARTCVSPLAAGRFALTDAGQAGRRAARGTGSRSHSPSGRCRRAGRSARALCTSAHLLTRTRTRALPHRRR